MHRTFKKPKDGKGKWVPKDTDKAFEAPAYQQPANQGNPGSNFKRARVRVRKLAPAPVYGCRRLVNAQQFIDWAKSQGFETTLEPGDLHATIAYSRTPMEWPTPRRTKLVVRGAKGRQVERLGDKGAVVLRFDSNVLANRWQQLRDAGASWDHDGYRPHITISYRVPEGFNLDAVKPYTGPLVFGPEEFKPIEEDQEHVEKMREVKQEVRKAISFEEALKRCKAPNPVTYFHCDVLKLQKAKKDDKGDLGLVFGWAIVSSENGEPYYDTQGDHIPDDSMLRAATEFMLSRRTMKIMHSGKQVGKVVFAWPMTPEIAEAMGINGGRTGLMIAVKPDNPNVLSRFRDGQYTGFSIGGNRLVDEDGDEDTAKALVKRITALLKYSENQPRDESGKWTAGGAAAALGGVATLAALGLGGGAALGVRGARHLLPAIRRAVLAARARGATRAARAAYTTSNFGSRRANLGAMTGAITASGREQVATNALRGARGIMSPAARRRAASRMAAAGVHRPMGR